VSSIGNKKRSDDDSGHAPSHRPTIANLRKSTIRNPQFAILLLLLLLVAPIQGQDNKCNRKLADLPQAPELFGFRPGLTIDQLKLVLPQIVFGPVDDLGSSKTTFNPHFDSRINTSAFAGVRSISLESLDGRISSVWIGYETSFKWKTVDEFVRGISLALQLPNDWQSWRLRGRQLRCTDFQMTVIMVADGPGFRILDLTADDIWAARRTAKEEQKAAEEENIQEPVIVGDRQSRLYYSAGCQPVKPIAETNRITFHTNEEAESTGYKLATACQ